jgi:hypothetical protein
MSTKRSGHGAVVTIKAGRPSKPTDKQRARHVPKRRRPQEDEPWWMRPPAPAPPERCLPR